MANESISGNEDLTHIECSEDNITFVERNIIEEQTHLMDCRNIEVMERRKRCRAEAEDNNEEWQQVSRRSGKKIRSQQNLNEDLIQICIRSKQLLPKQFALAKILRENKITDIIKVKYINNYKIYITFNKESSAEFFLACTTFTDLGWRCQKTWELGVSYGIIKNMDLDLSDEELLNNLMSDMEIIAVKRLNRRKEEKWVESESVKVLFKGPSLPAYVYILGLRIKVEPFIFPVTQCSKCWRYGHSAKLCPSNKVICPKCTKNHLNCENTNFQCVNCSGNHMALNKICPVYKKEKRIREIMSEFNCSYQKALSIYVPPSPINITESRNYPIETTQEHVYAPALSTNLSPTYVDRQRDELNTNQYDINSGIVNNSPRKKKQKKKKQNREAENAYADISLGSVQAGENDNESNGETNAEEIHKKSSVIRSLIDKIKIVIFKKNIDVSAKIKEIVQIIVECLTVTVVDFCSDLSKVKSLFSCLGKNG